MHIVWLKGDYVRQHTRQRQASAAGCAAVLEFHFNGDGPDARGAEVWHQPDRSASLAIASALLERFVCLGLPVHGDGLRPAVAGSRAGWIRAYGCVAVVLEPLFVSNARQAAWIHEVANLRRLAKGIAATISAAVPADAPIGLSVGHLFVPSRPHDHGAACALGDWEADHALRLAGTVAAALVCPAVATAAP